MRLFPRSLALALVSIAPFAASAVAQEGAGGSGGATPASGAGSRAVSLPETLVTVQKQQEDVQDVPFSVSPFTAEFMRDAGIDMVKDSSLYVPNTFITEFTARKLSNPRIRGVGGSPLNPGVTTYYDGVPQLNGNTASQEFIDIARVEFVRGPQGTLYGRNALGGVVNIISNRPSDRFSASLTGSYGNYDFRDVRLNISGPLIDKQLLGSFSFGHSAREGYTENTVTGHDLDSREAEFGRGQLLFIGEDGWEFRLIVSGEHSNDGDYALNDLNAVRANPYEVAHDFEGFVKRDVVSPTFIITHEGDEYSFASVTGFVWWDTRDQTDLDYTPFPIMQRSNSESATQFTQEFRLGSAKDKPLVLSDDLKLRWLAGVFIFQQNYDQDAVNNLNPIFLPPGVNAVQPQTAHFDDVGVGVFAQATLIVWDKLELTAGVRFDYEHKSAETFARSPAIALPDSTLDDSDSYTEVSPKFGIAYHVNDHLMPYASVAKGYRAGGFNATSNPGSESYDTEVVWTYEAGVKSQWFDRRLEVNFAAFYLDWQDIQLNAPVTVPAATGQFFITNAGEAVSRGIELEVLARPMAGWDIFGSAGYQDSDFRSDSVSGGVSVGGNDLPYTPDFSFTVGTQVFQPLCRDVTVYARAEVTVYGDYNYDEFDLVGQSAYNIASFRAGLRGNNWFVEGWVSNAFGANYVPLAFAFPGIAPSGYLGEPGAPRTFGVTAGINF